MVEIVILNEGESENEPNSQSNTQVAIRSLKERMTRIDKKSINIASPQINWAHTVFKQAKVMKVTSFLPLSYKSFEVKDPICGKHQEIKEW